MTRVQLIQRQAAEIFGVPLSDLLSDRRQRPIARARFAAICATRRLTHLTLPQIASRFGRDHSTVHYAIRQAERLAEEEPEFAARFSRLMVSADCERQAAADASAAALGALG